MRKSGGTSTTKRAARLSGSSLVFSIAIAVVTGCEMNGQSQPAAAPPAFAVASVKPTGRPPESGSSGWTVAHGTLTAPAAWVRGLIAFAHGVHAAQVHGGPEWVDTEPYDVIAKAEDTAASPDQIKAMLRTLLADRFKLAVHHQTQELPVYALVVGKNGSKMREAGDNEKTYLSFAGKGHLVCTRVNMLGLTITLSNSLGTPVHDETGLTGYYDFSLTWTDPLTQGGAQPPADSPVDIFRAVQEQLGLELDRKKGPVDTVVIDHIERASAN